VLEPVGDRRDMLLQAAARQQRAHHQRQPQPAQRRIVQQRGDRPADESRQADQQDHREDATAAPRRRRIVGVIERPVEPADQVSEQGCRVRQAAIEPGRIADQGIDQQRNQQGRQRIAGMGKVQHGMQPATAASRRQFEPEEVGR
jgi:hypothetical protein